MSRKVDFLRSISLAVFVFWLFLSDKVPSRSYVNLQHYRWRSFTYFTFALFSSHAVRHNNMFFNVVCKLSVFFLFSACLFVCLLFLF